MTLTLDLTTDQNDELTPIAEPILQAVGPLTIEDVAAYHVSDKPTNSVNSIRARHHLVAKMEAAGYRHIEIMAITGYSKQHFYLLRKNPAYTELVEHYMQEVSDRLFDFTEQIQYLHNLSMDRLREVLEDNQNLSPDFVRQVFATVSDRAGYGPSSSSTQRVEIGVLTGDDLHRLRNEVNDKDRALDAPVEVEVLND